MSALNTTSPTVVDKEEHNHHRFVMAANTRLASATEILCVLQYLGEGTTSLMIAKSLQTNSVVVLRLLKSMERAGLVSLRPGRDGGVSFARSPDEITLEQVNLAVETEGEVFALRDTGNPKCPVDKAMAGILGPIFTKVDRAVGSVLRRTTIGSLARIVNSQEAIPLGVAEDEGRS